ncbi:hypothetical protein TBLA_0B05270 [Henningerozyma blattae CBS 6284]|uniref:Uncharacterized protein n=1 Tax=Henningerozyma blattae (strain ATCC 34711 / CBS 6284 / DSM 70876 / NBRC 10599 / NRRL Y-10934 / UCD 77-7) TaxID=1071380 RepID=I2GZ07_HENB6|nr:hypothetical protein TBLA_0B05270 [Tetrapisispora blattae CBS 6284]CCH59359.1 hypothetical protein TBLA_0B05270 [Tetrapisispora blattae CBS 6284]
MSFTVKTSSGKIIDLKDNYTFIQGKKYYLVDECYMDLEEDNPQDFIQIKEKLNNPKNLIPKVKNKLGTTGSFHIWYRDIILYVYRLDKFWYQYMTKGNFDKNFLTASQRDVNYIELKKMMSIALCILLFTTSTPKYQTRLKLHFGKVLKNMNGHKMFLWIRNDLFSQNFITIQQTLGEIIYTCSTIGCNKKVLEEKIQQLTEELKYPSKVEWLVLDQLKSTDAVKLLIERGSYWGNIRRNLINEIYNQ